MEKKATTCTMDGDGFKLHIRYEHIRFVRETLSTMKGYTKLEVYVGGDKPLEVYLPVDAARKFVDGFIRAQFGVQA